MKKRILKILIVLAITCFAVGLSVACSKPHVHSFSTDYETSSSFHWQECSCGEKTNIGMHIGGIATCTERAICETCLVRYGNVKEHEFNIPVVTDTVHYLKCTCGETTTMEEHVLSNGACACGYNKPDASHVHQCDALNFNDYSHWYQCSCGVTENGANHEGTVADCDHKSVCSGCSQEYGDYGHVWNNGELTVAPTETTDGKATYTCLLCRDNKEETVSKGTKIYTRADLEKAVVEVGWAYYAKGKQVQYDSTNINRLTSIYGGTSRHSQEVSPEYGSSDTTIFSVCTAYTSAAYLEATGHRIFEQRGHTNAITTHYLWYMGENQNEDFYFATATNSACPITELDRDVSIMRWVDYDKYLKTSELENANKFGVFQATSFYDWYEDGILELRKEKGKYVYYLDNKKISYEEAKSLCFEYLLENENGEFVNMRLGDVLVYDGHALLYIGNGYVLDCNGAKFDPETGLDKIENNGGIAGRMLTLASTLESAKSDFIIIRPFDFYASGCDGNLDNDIIVYDGKALEVTDATITREKYPAMNIDRTIDITPFGTIAQGENVTYKVKITNNTTNGKYKFWRGGGYVGQDYNDLVITEKIPQGTTFVSAYMGTTPTDGTLTWTVDIPAGESVELTYTVRVDAPIGSVIVSDGGFVENIPSNVIKNRVGGAKLSEQQKAVLNNIASTSTSTWATTYGKDMDFAKNIYGEMGVNLNFANVQELVENLYKPTLLRKQISFGSIYPNINDELVMYMPQKTVGETYQQVKSMLVDGYYGGYRIYDIDLEKVADVGVENIDISVELNKSIIEFKMEYLEVGDIIVYATAKNRTDLGLTSQLASYEIAIYVGDGKLISINSSGKGTVYANQYAKEWLLKAMMSNIDIFFALRPSQAGVIS
ncbi:MAG: DUF11 domain-containing protein [Clostridiales bacterium]|nr:DUF11 domain-containing protein [Clostridiales bacterium]